MAGRSHCELLSLGCEGCDGFYWRIAGECGGTKLELWERVLVVAVVNYDSNSGRKRVGKRGCSESGRKIAM